MSRKRLRSAAGCSGCGCGLLLGVLGIIIAVNNRIPAMEYPNPVMPNPNARDLILRAASQAQNSMAFGRGAGNMQVSQHNAILAADAPALQTLHQSFRYPFLEPPVRSASALPLAALTQFRDLNRSVLIDSQAEAIAGRWDAAAELALDDVQLGEMIPHGAESTGVLTGYSCAGIGCQQAWAVLNHVSAEEARHAIARLQEDEALHVPVREIQVEEKWCGLAITADLLRHVDWKHDLTTGSKMERLQGASGDLALLLQNKETILKHMSQSEDRVIELASQPWSSASVAPAPTGDAEADMAISNMITLRVRELKDLVQLRMLEIGFALRLYRLEHHAYPASLNELVSAHCLKLLPPDPFRPAMPLMYHLNGKKPVLYSVGPDGVDNGGTPVNDTSKVSDRAARMVDEHSKGDMVMGVNW